MSRTHRKWQEFRLRYCDLFRHIQRDYPGFWGEVAEVWQTHLEETYTTRGAVVQEFSSTREVGVQATSRGDAGVGASAGVSQGVQTPTLWTSLTELEAVVDRRVVEFVERRGSDRREFERREGERREADRREAARRQAERREAERRGATRREADKCAEVRRNETAGLSTARPDRGGASRPGCWNCGSLGHRYSECPNPRTEGFCFRCGTAGTTLRDCRNCREEWREQGPYVPGRGHMSRGAS